VLRTSKRPEPANLVHCPSCDRHEPFCYSRRHRPTPKNTLRGNPGCAVGPKTPTICSTGAKGSTQTNKKSKIGFKKKGAKENRRLPWSGAPDYLVCHRTVSSAPGWINSNSPPSDFWKSHSDIIHRTVRCTTGLSGVPSGATVASATVDSNGRLTQQTVRIESEQRQKAHRTVNSDCLVHPWTVRWPLHDGSLTATYGWLLKRPSATYGWSLKTFSDP
jgi:hypothetical protein